MLYGQNRTELRRMYLNAWRKRCESLPMEPMEMQIADVIALHPEYQRLLADDSALEKDWLPEMGESNPFLHMGMHLGLREQVATDRPAGIAALYRRAIQRMDAHEVEHRFMECLAEALWHAQRNGLPPDEATYLDCLSRV